MEPPKDKNLAHLVLTCFVHTTAQKGPWGNSVVMTKSTNFLEEATDMGLCRVSLTGHLHFRGTGGFLWKWCCLGAGEWTPGQVRNRKCLHFQRDPDPVPLPMGREGLYLWSGHSLLLWPLIGWCADLGAWNSNGGACLSLLLWPVREGFPSFINNMVNCHSTAFVKKAFHKKSQLRSNDDWAQGTSENTGNCTKPWAFLCCDSIGCFRLDWEQETGAEGLA